jgi:hypothetical protein
MDGQTERVNQILEDMLRACVLEHQGSWDHNLPWAEFSYNNIYQESLWFHPQFPPPSHWLPPPHAAIRGAHCRVERPPFSFFLPHCLCAAPDHRPAHRRWAAADRSLWLPSDPIDPTPSFVQPNNSSPTVLTPQETPTPACRPSSPTANPLHCEQAAPVNPLLSATPNLVCHPASLLPQPAPLHLVGGSRRISADHRRPMRPDALPYFRP